MATPSFVHLGFGLQRQRLKNYIALLSVLGVFLAATFRTAQGAGFNHPGIMVQMFLAALFLGLYFFSKPNWLWALLGSQVIFIILEACLHADLHGLSYSRVAFSFLTPIAALSVEYRMRGSAGQISFYPSRLTNRLK